MSDMYLVSTATEVAEKTFRFVSPETLKSGEYAVVSIHDFDGVNPGTGKAYFLNEDELRDLAVATLAAAESISNA